jgi:hypothetical protein
MVLTYVEALRNNSAFVFRPSELNAMENLAFLAFVRDYGAWSRIRAAN